MDWVGWPLERILFLFIAGTFLLVFVQVTLFHYRQNFRHWSMWIPVLATPVLSVLSFYYVIYNQLWLRVILAILFSVGIMAGMFGSYMHVRGVGERVGGYEMRNFMTGPPLALPGLITGVSALGLIALFWGW